MSTVKTLHLEAVVPDGELPPPGLWGYMDYLHNRREFVHFYNTDADGKSTTGGRDPDEIAGIAWEGIAHVLDEGAEEDNKHHDGTPLRFDGTDVLSGYIFAIDTEGTRYLWSFEPKVEKTVRVSDEQGGEFLYLSPDPEKVEQIAREIRRIREGGRA